MSDILETLRPLANPAKAAEMQRYHKTDRDTLGVANPQIDTAIRTWREGRSVRDWVTEADALWHSGVFEARVAAGKLLTKARFRQDEALVWDTIAAWVPDFDGWAIADHAASAGARRVMANLSRLDALEAWAAADLLWTRRAALIFALELTKPRHPTSAQAEARSRVLGWAAGMADDHRWFIQKAIGWWLRSLSQRDPDTVRAFLDTHGERLKPFARREAARKLP